MPTGLCIHPTFVVIIYPITVRDLPSHALVLSVAVTTIVGWGALLGLGTGEIRSHVEVGKGVVTR